MDNNLKYQHKTFRYEGRKFILTENNLEFIPGFRFKAYGYDVITVNKSLPKWKKQLEIHRLIAGKGLRDIRTAKNI